MPLSWSRATASVISWRSASGHAVHRRRARWISGRIARALHPDADIRIENFRDTRLPENRIDAVIGNVPFADVKLDYAGRRLALDDTSSPSPSMP